MASVDWILASPPPIPTVTAIVETNEWSLTSETTHNHVQLFVYHQSLLTLVCMAGYPLVWSAENQQDLPQVKTEDPLGQIKRGSYWPYTKGPITVTDKYTSVLTIRNFTARNAGLYHCGAETIPNRGLISTVDLQVGPQEPENDTIATVIQTGFDILRSQPGRLYRYTSTETSNSMIYSIPPNAQVHASVFTPVNQHDFDVDWTKRLYCLNETVPPTSIKFDSGFISNEVTMECAMLNTRLGKITVTSIMGESQNVYTFILQTISQNMVISEWRETFQVWVDITEYRVAQAEAMTPFDAATFLTIGQIYEIRMYTSNFILSAADLYAWPLQWSPIARHTNKSSPEDCDPIGYPNYISTQECGIVGVSLFNETFNHNSDVGVRITIQIRGACLLKIVQSNGTRQNWTEEDNDFPQGTNYLLSFGQRSEEKQEYFAGALSIAALEPGTFGQETEGAKLYGGRNCSEKKVSKDDTQLTCDLQNDFVAYTNETVKMICVLPMCYRFGINLCTNTTCELPSIKYRKEYLNIEDGNSPKMGIISSIGPQTLIVFYDIPSVQKNDSAEYTCMLQKPSLRKQGFAQLSRTKVKLTVRDPTAPKFISLEPTVVTRILKSGSTASLVCKVDGDPPPNISWYKVDTNEEHMNETSQDTLDVSQPGTYMCTASSKYGAISKRFQVQYESAKSYLPFAIAIPIAILFIVMTAFLVWWISRRALRASLKELSKSLSESRELIPLDESTFLNDQIQFLQYNRCLEIDRSQFTVTSKLLGLGEFGSIFKGELKINDSGVVREIAVKVPKNSLNLQQFNALTDELKIMSHIRPHVNVLTLIGACTKDIEKRQLFGLTEFCENGSLRDYLMKNYMKFEGFEVNSSGQFLGAPGAVEALLNYSYQAANGMIYLAAERVIHRDLALRNLLLTANHIVKISDFGMSRQPLTSAIYHKRLSPDVPVPVFWMALESLINGQFTLKSDVWSFGIVLWEIFSCGRNPYPDHKPDAAFLAWLRQKEENRMRPPTIACEEIYQLMHACWKVNPDARPSFGECKRSISHILEERSPTNHHSMVVSLSDAWSKLNVSPNPLPSSNGSSSNLEDPVTKLNIPLPNGTNPYASVIPMKSVHPNDPMIDEEISPSQIGDYVSAREVSDCDTCTYKIDMSYNTPL